VHEASHNLVFERAALNKIPGNRGETSVSRSVRHGLSPLPFCITNQSAYAAWTPTFRRLGGTAVHNSSLRKLAWLLLLPVSYGLGASLPCPCAPALRYLAYRKRCAIAVAWVAVCWFLGWHAVAIFCCPPILQSGPSGRRTHPVRAHRLRRRRRHGVYYGPINLMSLNLGFHLEHHDMPAIAGWRLPALRRTAPEFYEHITGTNRASWALAIVFDPGIGSTAVPFGT